MSFPEKSSALEKLNVRKPYDSSSRMRLGEKSLKQIGVNRYEKLEGAASKNMKKKHVGQGLVEALKRHEQCIQN